MNAPQPEWVRGWPEAVRQCGLAMKHQTAKTFTRGPKEWTSIPEITDVRPLGNGTWEAKLTPAVGSTLFDVALKDENLARALGLYQLVIDRTDPSNGTLIVNERNPFPAIVPWYPPRENTYMARIGVTSAGQDFGFHVGHAPHAFMAGATNSGKSKAIIAGYCSAFCMDGVEGWGIDPKGVDFPPLRDRFSDLVTGDDHDEIRDFLERALAGMDERLEWLGREGFESLDAWCQAKNVGYCERWPWVELLLDEFQDVAEIPNPIGKNGRPDSSIPTCLDMATRIVRKGRAAGLRSTAATQNPLASVVKSGFRGNFSTRWVGKTQGPNETAVGLGNPDAAKRCPAHRITELSGEAFWIGAARKSDGWHHSAHPVPVKAALLTGTEITKIAAVTMRQKPAPTLPGCTVIASRIPPVSLEGETSDQSVVSTPTETDSGDSPHRRTTDPTPAQKLIASLPPKPAWRYLPAGDFPYPASKGKAAEHRIAAWEHYGDRPACMACAEIGTFATDGIRVASIDGTRNLAKDNLYLACRECLGAVKGAKAPKR